MELYGVSVYGDPSFKGDIYLYYNDYLPLDAEDYRIHPYQGPIVFEHGPIKHTSDYLKSIVQERATNGRMLQFALTSQLPGSDGDYQTDGREFSTESIILIVSYTD